MEGKTYRSTRSPRSFSMISVCVFGVLCSEKKCRRLLRASHFNLVMKFEKLGKRVRRPRDLGIF